MAVAKVIKYCLVLFIMLMYLLCVCKKCPKRGREIRLLMVGAGEWCSGGAAHHLLEGNTLGWERRGFIGVPTG
ncbi:hypothetical protein BHU16_09345 [Tannerella sp. oral taxon 808]|nr:hypothetical protein BHU16_09345 [Tannerella sp. oral taxon 808]